MLSASRLFLVRCPLQYFIFTRQICRMTNTSETLEIKPSDVASVHYYGVQGDFRSDTVTVPTDQMFAAMSTASRQDDVLEEDPSVRHLETHIAALLDHEDALFCVSGTMTNQLALRTLLVQPPHSVLCDARSHVYMWEAGGISFHCQASVTPVHPSGNMLTLQDIKDNIVHEDIHTAATRVVSLENTLGGRIFPIEELRIISKFCKANQLKLHLDGARIWNASVATGVSLNESMTYWLVQVSVCLSKGLGAPIGSCLVGPVELVKKARHFRKLYGGGWRQAGFLAGAALHCLEHVYPHGLFYSHVIAADLAQSLQELGAIILNTPVQTNVVFVDLSPIGITGCEVARECTKLGIHMLFTNDSSKLRLVTHYQLSKSAAIDLVEVIQRLVDNKKHQDKL